VDFVMPIKDLTNIKFGRLTPINYIGNNKNRVAIWKCQCDCGNVVNIISSSLLSGNTKSCGCYNSDRAKEKLNDLTGQKFGRLTVISLFGFDKSRSSLWKCQCDCGRILTVKRYSLVSGHTKSCGCYHIDKVKASKYGNPNKIKGTFGYYSTFHCKLKIYNECRRLPEDDSVLQVKCIYCGKWFIPTINQINSRISVIYGNSNGDLNFYCSKGCKQSCPIYHKSKYPEGYKKATSREIQPELRKLVFERDEYTCQKCGSIENLHCHHYEGVEQNPIESADIDNCITLCKKCHKYIHSQKGCSYYDYRCK